MAFFGISTGQAFTAVIGPLVAMTAMKHAPRPLDIWALLPHTNCKKCSEAACMAFACNLLLQERELEECSPLHSDEAFAQRRATLADMLL